MTSEGLGKNFEGDSADMCGGIFGPGGVSALPLADGGLIGGSSVRRPGSEDPHWR